MTIRRLNFTGRKRISKDSIRLVVTKNETTFELKARLELQHYGFPTESAIYLEAYKRAGFQRFDFGTVGKQTIPVDLSLASFSSPQGLRYRLKIVDMEQSRGRILGEIDNLRAVVAENIGGTVESLLPVEPSHGLGNEVYRLEFSPNEIHLLVNADLTDWRSAIKDPYFITLVFPNLLRQILLHILQIEEYREVDDSTDWRSQWLAHTLTELRARPIPVAGDLEDDQGWVDEAVLEFCKEHRILGRFKKALGEE